MAETLKTTEVSLYNDPFMRLIYQATSDKYFPNGYGNALISSKNS